MAHDREVGGIRCTEVLERLSDYVEGDVEAAVKARIDTHLKGCDWCERFGGSYAQTVGHLRELLATPGPLDEVVQERLRGRLGEALDGEAERHKDDS